MSKQRHSELVCALVEVLDPFEVAEWLVILHEGGYRGTGTVRAVVPRELRRKITEKIRRAKRLITKSGEGA